MRIGYFVASSFLKHPGIRRRIDKTIGFFRGHNHYIELIECPDSSQHHFLRFFTSPNFLIKNFDIILLRSNLPTPNWKYLKVPIISERHVFSRHSESPKDLIRVVWENSISNPLSWSSALVYVTEEMRLRDKTTTRSVVLGNCSSLEYQSRNWSTIQPNRIGLALRAINRSVGLDLLNAFAESHSQYDVRVVFNSLHSRSNRIFDAHRAFPALNFVETKHFTSYISELQTWSCAIGPLALSRKGLTEAAPLKVRDYIALSIPSVLSYIDTNLKNSNDCALLKVSDFSANAYEEVAQFIENSSSITIKNETFNYIASDNIERKRMSLVESVFTDYFH
jgi:hypothetical protein